MDVIVDIQGFYGISKEIIVKEIALLSVDGVFVQHILFKPPFAKHKLHGEQLARVERQERSGHRIEWGAGFVEYDEFAAVLKSLTSTARDIFVRGGKKQKFITRVLNRSVYELTNYYPDCPTLKALRQSTAYKKCLYPFNHSRHTATNCALENVYILQHWVNNEFAGHRNNTDDELLQFNCASRCICL